MNTFIALFRGINVGGNNRLPMQALRDTLHSIGLSEAKTYIQSGNAVFNSSQTDCLALADKIKSAIEQQHQLAPATLVLNLNTLKAAIGNNPFRNAVAEPASLHLYFLFEQPSEENYQQAKALCSNGEQIELIDAVVYLHAPNGIGRSKLAAKIDKVLQVQTTARNWRSVNKVLDLTAK